MNKIGILTFQRTLNFGAMLQCYALQRVLSENGFAAEVIDYKCERVEAREGLLFDGSAKSAAKILLRRGKARRFSKFSSAIPMSPRCDRVTFPDVASRYDHIVVGSDQVWNLECTGGDTTFFLDQVNDPARKKTYAASIGYERLPDYGAADYSELIGGFSSVLVREPTAARAVEPYANAPARTVLDPTLLLPRQDWLHIADVPPCVKGRHYVLVYAISEFERSLEAARRIAEERGCEIVQIQQYGLSRTKGAVNLRNISPAEFVGLFAGAEAAVVSSFHGCCLSILNQCDFYYATDKGSESKASRVLDLAALLGIEHRGVDDYLLGKSASLDYVAIDTRLSEERGRSVSLLLESLR